MSSGTPEPGRLPASAGTAERVMRLLAFAALYLIGAWGGQALFIAPDLGAALWPPGGIFLASLLLTTRKEWPLLIGVGLCADFMASMALFGSPAGVSLAVAMGNTLEATAGAYLLQRWASGAFRLGGTASVLAFVLFSALVSPLLSTAVGGTAMSLHTGEPLLTSWKLWWTGDSAGVLIFAPLLLGLLSKSEECDEPAAGRGELLLMLGALLLVGHLVLAQPYPTIFILLPVLIWAALRGEHRCIALANAVVTLQVLLYTQRGLGPFAADFVLAERQLLAQSFIMASALTGLVLAGQASQRRRSALELIAARQAAENALAAAEAARASAEHASQVKSQFLANMSHEFRTPLNAVIGLGHLLTQMDLPRKAGEYATHIQQAGQHLLALTSDVLDLSHIEAGGMRLEQVPFSLPALMEEVRALVQLQAQEKGLALHLSLAPTLPATLVGDPLRLKQVLLNLLGNAVKFTPAGSVGLHVRELGQAAGRITLRMDVTDSGIGIAPEQQQRIFDAFTQADASTTRVHGGTGLGLSIARQLVVMMGGEINLESAVGRGSTFSVTVPMALDAGSSPDVAV